MTIIATAWRNGGAYETGFSMKKTEIVKFRSDAETLAAIKRLCDESGRTLSEMLRDSVAQELTRRRAPCAEAIAGGVAAQPFEVGEAAHLRGLDLRACAHTLSSILIEPSRGRGERHRDDVVSKRRQVSRILEALFRALNVHAN
jgi:hypothetical protein